jgi:glutamate/tyrosine decarboxylase-like PLP-dependent enzyme
MLGFGFCPPVFETVTGLAALNTGKVLKSLLSSGFYRLAVHRLVVWVARVWGADSGASGVRVG